MTVALASLENLIPQQPKWAGFVTRPIRLPEKLISRVLDMVNTWVQEIKIDIGEDTPEGQTEQEWINEMIGLPADHREGDPLPAVIKAEIAEIAAEPKSETAAIAEPEPPVFTRAWLDWAKRKNPDFNEAVYIQWVKDEAKQGLPGAKEDLATLKASGVDIGERVLSPRQQAKNARRAARAEKANAGQVSKSVETVKPAARLAMIDDVTEPDYADVLECFHEQARETLAEFNAFFEELEIAGKQGKIKRFNSYLERNSKNLLGSVEFWLSMPIMDETVYLDHAAMAFYSKEINSLTKELKDEFMKSDEQKKEGNLDNRFCRIMNDVWLCFSLACVAARPEFRQSS